jgi:exonuclease III
MIESNKIIGGFWNIRGLNNSGRMKCLADFINQNRLDFVGIQETKSASRTLFDFGD